MLYLQQQLDPLNGGHGHLGDGSSDVSHQEILVEGDSQHGVSAHIEWSPRVGAMGSVLLPQGSKGITGFL